MKGINCILGFIVMSTIAACGGGSPQETLPELESLENFSLKVQQVNTCGEYSPLSDATILVYDESPNENPQSEFTTYITGEDGLLELDLDKAASISFTVTASSTEDYYVDERTIVSFIDLAVDNYAITMLSGEAAFNNDSCECQSVSVEASVNMPGEPDERISYAEIFIGNNSDSASYTIDGSTVSFSNVEVCGEAEKSLPLVVAVMTEAGCSDCFLDYIVGVVESPDYNNSIVPVQVDTMSQVIQKPDYLSDISITHERYFKNTHYLKDWGVGRGHLSLDEFDLGEHAFKGLDYTISGVYNGNPVDRNKTTTLRISYQDSSDMSLIGETPIASNMTVQFDEPNKSYIVVATGTEDYDLMLSTNSFIGGDIGNTKLTHWSIYSPNTGNSFMPKLTSEIENELESLDSYSRSFYVRDYDDANSYSDSLNKTLLSSELVGRASKREVRLTYENEATQAKVKSILKLKAIETEH